MSDNKGGAPAFPSAGHSATLAKGMTKREWYYGQVMSGTVWLFVQGERYPPGEAKRIAAVGLKIAYAMLAAQGDRTDSRLLEALTTARTTIKALHGSPGWQEYQGSPEMKEINKAIALAMGNGDDDS